MEKNCDEQCPSREVLSRLDRLEAGLSDLRGDTSDALEKVEETAKRIVVDVQTIHDRVSLMEAKISLWNALFAAAAAAVFSWLFTKVGT